MLLISAAGMIRVRVLVTICVTPWCMFPNRLGRLSVDMLGGAAWTGPLVVDSAACGVPVGGGGDVGVRCAEVIVVIGVGFVLVGFVVVVVPILRRAVMLLGLAVCMCVRLMLSPPVSVCIVGTVSMLLAVISVLLLMWLSVLTVLIIEFRLDCVLVGVVGIVVGMGVIADVVAVVGVAAGVGVRLRLRLALRLVVCRGRSVLTLNLVSVPLALTMLLVRLRIPISWFENGEGILIMVPVALTEISGVLSTIILFLCVSYLMTAVLGRFLLRLGSRKAPALSTCVLLLGLC